MTIEMLSMLKMKRQRVLAMPTVLHDDETAAVEATMMLALMKQTTSHPS